MIRQWLERLSCRSTLRQLVNKGLLSGVDAGRVWRHYGFKGELG